MGYVSTSKWVVFDNRGNKLKTVTLKHKDGAVYKEIDSFEAKLKEQGLYAHRAESFEWFKSTRIPFIQQLKYLGWEFNGDGVII